MQAFKRLFSVALILVFSSCGDAVRKSINFSSNVRPDTVERITTFAPPRPTTIKPGDILAINVVSQTPGAREDILSVLNRGGIPYGITAGAAGGSAIAANGYLVDAEGNIGYPIIGPLKIAGLTIPEARAFFVQKIATVLTTPVYVEVRITNFRVTVLGEVPRPGPVVAANHDLTLVDALAAAGDLPLSARRDNIKITREEDGKRVEARVNLTSRDVYNSPYYKLQQNDQIYVEASKLRRQEQNEFLRFYLPLILGLIQTGVTFFYVREAVRNN